MLDWKIHVQLKRGLVHALLHAHVCACMLSCHALGMQLISYCRPQPLHILAAPTFAEPLHS